MGGGWSDPRGSDARRRDPGWGGRDSDRRDPRGPGGSRRDPGPPAGRSGDPGAGAQTRRMPAQPGPTPPTPPTPPTRTQPAGTRPGPAQPRAVRDGGGRDGGGRDGEGRDGEGRDGGPRDYRGRRNSQRPGRPRRWGALQGGLGVCIIVASAAIGATATVVTRSVPGVLLGFFVVAGTIAAALAVRPRTGRLILPVPVLSYLVAALISGVVYNRSADSSKTALAIGAAQWIANGFFAMALATVLAAAIIAVRWYLWRRNRPATRGPDWPAGAGRDGTGRRPGTTWETSAGPGYPAGRGGPDNPRPGRPRESGWSDAGPRGADPRPWPPQGRPGSGPYNFSSGA